MGMQLCCNCGSLQSGMLLMHVPCAAAARDVSPRVGFQCLHSPRVQSHAVTAICILKIPGIVNHIITWTPENAAHIKSTLQNRLSPGVLECTGKKISSAASLRKVSK